MKIKRIILITSVLFLFLQQKSIAQTLTVGTAALEDFYRRSQLFGLNDSLTSFTVRPLFLNTKYNISLRPDSGDNGYLQNKYSYYQSKNRKFNAWLLPVNIQTQTNTDHSYGWNDGAMIPAKGLQTMFSAGFFARYGILSIQLSPEVVLAENSDFDTFHKTSYDIVVARYYDIYNNIDLPVRFGASGYKKFYWGQSSIRLNYKGLSLGLSTENLWWGPGIRNSLLMSNSAPGFQHLTFNTTKPLKTAIGSFEGQLIAGRLEQSGYNPLDSGRTYFSNQLYIPKPTDRRYLSGLVITWQPKWVAGLFLGFTSSKQLYNKDLSTFSDYVPIFSPFRNYVADQPINRRDTRSSMFARWVLPEEHAEIYFEYGINNNTNSFQNSLLEPQDARAYIFGLRKAIPFNTSRNESILISVEATQLQETNPDKILSGAEWYVNPYIRQGYTNRGESLGAGIGPGANLQTLDVSWIKGLKKIGIQFERYLHNDDLYYYTYTATKDFRRHWVDLSVAANGEWNYKNFIFNAKLQYIKSLNYQWYLLQLPGEPYFVDGLNATNFQIQAGATYRF